jgi:DNA-binding transcriptional MocR family regulator
MPEANRQRLVELCRTHGVRMIEDDIYAELVDDGAPRTMLADDDGSTVSYVSSFSKTVSPGLRVGVCFPGTLHDAFAARKCQQDLHSAVTSEVILREFLLAGSLDPHLLRLRARNFRRREIGLKAVRDFFPAGTKVESPQGGYMLWLELPERADLPELRRRARAEGIVFAAGDVFFTGEIARSCLRLNCAKATEEELARGVATLGRLCGQI